MLTHAHILNLITPFADETQSLGARPGPPLSSCYMDDPARVAAVRLRPFVPVLVPPRVGAVQPRPQTSALLARCQLVVAVTAAAVDCVLHANRSPCRC